MIITFNIGANVGKIETITAELAAFTAFSFGYMDPKIKTFIAESGEKTHAIETVLPEGKDLTQIAEDVHAMSEILEQDCIAWAVGGLNGPRLEPYGGEFAAKYFDLIKD